MPKVLTEKHRLIEPKVIKDLVGRSPQDIGLALADSTYRKEISEIPLKQLSSLSLERAFVKSYMRTCMEIMHHSPNDIAFLLSSILMKFEISTVKTILRATEANLKIEEVSDLLVPAGSLNDVECRRILANSQTVNEVVSALSGLEYGPTLRESLEQYDRTGIFLFLEMSLDKFVCQRLWRSAVNLKGLDRKIGKTIIGLEVDAVNIRTLLRCKMLGIDKGQTKQNLLPVSDVFRESEFKAALESADIPSAIATLSKDAEFAFARDYRYVLDDILEEYRHSGSLPQLELALERSLLRVSLRMLKRYTPFFNIGLILTFLTLKGVEIRNLVACARGKEGRLSTKRIHELLIFP
ncbi:MAG: V-type ATPase subunit [Candidatus Bathyarchaeota archaeon]|nr:MAG: V-type ATPase subunit [Candidatus Bathyarchaeota archaeon]